MQFRMRNIHTYKNRHGKAYIYYRDRRTGFLRRLPSDTKSPEFYEAWKQADADNHGTVPEAQRGTWAELKASYLKSPEFQDLSDRTRKDYAYYLKRVHEMDAVPVDQMTPASLMVWRDKIAEGGRRRTANYTLTVMSRVFKMGILRGLTKDNPLREVPKLKRAKDKPKANRPWTDGELDAMMGAATPQIRTAIALAAYTGMRQGDVLTFTWGSRANGYISPRKTGDVVFVPEHSKLTKILDATPKTATVVVASDRGHAYTSDGFRSSFFRLRDQLVTEGKIGAGLTFHGLRHTVATKLADAGADAETIAAVTGHKSMAMVRHYTESRDKKKLARAAIRLIDKD
jgi:integrase